MYNIFGEPTTGLDDPNSPNPTACINESTTYTLTAINHKRMCSATADVMIGVNPTPAPTVTIPELVICANDNSQTFQPEVSPVSGTYTYSWSPTTGLSDPYIANPTVYPLQLGSSTYTLTVTNEDGCQTITDVDVIVQNCASSNTLNKTIATTAYVEC